MSGSAVSGSKFWLPEQKENFVNNLGLISCSKRLCHEVHNLITRTNTKNSCFSEGSFVVIHSF